MEQISPCKICGSEKVSIFDAVTPRFIYVAKRCEDIECLAIETISKISRD